MKELSDEWWCKEKRWLTRFTDSTTPRNSSGASEREAAKPPLATDAPAARAASDSSTSDTVTAAEFDVETTARAIATLDAQFPWLRGAERRLPAKSPHSKTHRTRALTAEREKPMQESIPSGITLMGLPLSPDVETPPDSGCVNCGSSHIEPFESYGPTGVRAPDGGAEYSSDAGIHCLDCGANEPRPKHVNGCARPSRLSSVEAAWSPQREHLVAMTLHFRELVSALFAVPTTKEVN